MKKRVFITINELSEAIPLTIHQIYKAVKKADCPLPHRKCGKRLLFEMDEVYAWFDSLPGANTSCIDGGNMKIGNIEKEISIPVGNNLHKPILPWPNFKDVNDSVLFTPDTNENQYQLYRRLSNSAYAFGQLQDPPWKFKAKRLKDGTIRIWRIE